MRKPMSVQRARRKFGKVREELLDLMKMEMEAMHGLTGSHLGMDRWVKINTDAGYCQNSGLAGLRVVARDCYGKVCLAYNGSSCIC
jgi:hypothetical protein